jgi:hypothetical protein
MNYIHHMNQFLRIVKNDARLSPSHISLYMALFQQWNENYFHNPITLHRQEILTMAHIGSKNTYSRCLKELHDFGYLIYQPAPHKYQRAMVSMRRFYKNQILLPEQLVSYATTKATVNNNTGTVPILNPAGTNIDPHTVSFVGHSLNKQENNRNIEDTPDPFSVTNYPSLNTVITYFKKNGYPATEARRFFFHYEANGWKQAGKYPLESWIAAANKWVEPSSDSSSNKSSYSNTQNNLHAGNLQSYSDPL